MPINENLPKIDLGEFKSEKNAGWSFPLKDENGEDIPGVTTPGDEIPSKEVVADDTIPDNIPTPYVPPDAPHSEDTYTKGRDYLDPDKSTMAGQMEGLLGDAESNPMVQMRQSQALQAMQGRGLKNTSMATTAADAAMYQYLTPIAQQDAQTYAAMDRLDADYDFKTDFWNKQNAFDKMALEMNLSMDERQMMTTAFAGMFNNISTAAGRIMVDDSLDAQGKRTAMDELWQNYQDSVTTFSDLNNYDYEW